MNHKILSIPIPSERRLVRRSRTSALEAFEAEGGRFWLKTYRYPPPLGPLRGICRNTFLAPSRAAREWRALGLLAEAGLQPDLRVEIAERRWLGFLLRSSLLTRNFGEDDLAARLARSALDREELGSLARFVRALHDAGLRDPDLFARNLCCAGAGAAIHFAKIDAGASRRVAPGARWGRRRRRDVEGLARDLGRLGLGRRACLRFVVLQWFPGPRPGRATGS